MKYLVTEVQSFPGGATSTPTYAYDSKVIGSQSEAELAAKAKYYALLSGAAQSKVPMHAVLMYTDSGFYLMSEHFTHGTESVEEETAE